MNFNCVSFNDGVIISEYMATNGGSVSEFCNGKYMASNGGAISEFCNGKSLHNFRYPGIFQEVLRKPKLNFTTECVQAEI